MRYRRWAGILFVIVAITVALYGAGCVLRKTAAPTAVSTNADQLFTGTPSPFAPNTKIPDQLETPNSGGPNTEEPAVSPTAEMPSSTETPVPTDTPTPTETPVPTNTPTPTETPVPTPTEVKPFMEDEEEDCEVLQGSMGEGGCPADLSTFAVFPCENPGLYTFKVHFYNIKDINTTDVCFFINGDGDPDTGFTDHPLFGVDWVYCWSGQAKQVMINTFDAGGNYIKTITVSDPYTYVLLDAGGENVSTDPFQMTFPPSEFAGTSIAPNIDIGVEAMYFSSKGDMVWDRVEPVSVAKCPTQ